VKRGLLALWQSLAANRAETAPEASRPSLRGRTYAIPFDRVWQAATELADGGLRGWSLHAADDIEGIFSAERRVWWQTIQVDVRIGLDPDGQTRLDLQACCCDSMPDLGASRRTIQRFTQTLDRRLSRGAQRRASLPVVRS
jgi:hypothetical protein